MARLFVPPEQLSGSRVQLDRAASKHLLKVLRLQIGAEVCVFDGRGTEIDARIVSVAGGGAELELGERHDIAVPGASITLLQALPRPDRMDLIVQKTTELGVTKLVPVLSERSLTTPPAGKQRRWQVIAQEAARQSGRADVPEIAAPACLAEALEALGPSPTRLVLWEEERGLPMRRALSERSSKLALELSPRPGIGSVALLVGPEGGLAVTEVERARAHGFVSVSLGPRILRVETAAMVAVALTQASAGGLD
jgi:16S rRNA (uracil1498-N3)-methyltransferase